MTHVVAEPCFGCKYTDCVVVCPVECFYEGEKILYIHPDECIDCEACVPECPVEAIFHEDNLPEQWADFNAAQRRNGAAVPGDHRKERTAGGERIRCRAKALARVRGDSSCCLTDQQIASQILWSFPSERTIW